MALQSQSEGEPERIVLACSECGGRCRAFRDDPLWPLCTCSGVWSPKHGGVRYPTLTPAIYDLA